MADEAGTLRVTPYEAVFGVDRLAELEFPQIAEEAERRGVLLSSRDQFAGLQSVGKLLQHLVPEDADAVAVDHHLDILYHCFAFWEADCPVYALEAPAIRSLLGDQPGLAGWQPCLAHPSCYIELPRTLFWAAVTENEPPEPAEGLFVKLGRGRRSSEAELLVVFGMRPDRPGFSVAGLTVDLQQARELEEPNAFASDIPGADLAGLYFLSRPSEVVLLMMQLLWYIDSYPEAIERVESGHAGKLQESGPRVLTTLGHYRVRLVERSRG